MSHNRKKRYILEEGRPVPFLVDLGVQTKEGKVITSRYDKFRQINRFLEFIEDIWPLLPKDRPVHIIDFGCGKSYLTFAMYYYLHELKGLTLEVTGLDLKKDVIVHCNELAKKYHYEGLSFLHGDIADYTGTDSADMVVTLHACDTATDYALYKAMKWHAGVILSVPCCQHEVNKQIACEPLEGALKYGLIKERLSALFTDALRADLLEENGYDTQVLEFIDMEHTPKKILLRAVRRVDAGMADGQSGLTEAEQKLGQCSKEPGYKEPDSKRLAGNPADPYDAAEASGRRVGLKKTVIKGIAFVVIFVISLVVISMVANQGNGDMTAPMSAASLPTMAIVEDGQEINQMYGYTMQMDTADMRESITPIKTARQINAVVHGYGTEIAGVSYELRSIDGSRLIENTELTGTQEGDDLYLSFRLKDLMKEGEEYSLIFLVNLDESDRCVIIRGSSRRIIT